MSIFSSEYVPIEIKNIITQDENILYSWEEKVKSNYPFNSWFIVTNVRIVQFYDDSPHKDQDNGSKNLINYIITDFKSIEIVKDPISGLRRLSIISNNGIPHYLYYYPFDHVKKIYEILKSLMQK